MFKEKRILKKLKRVQNEIHVAEDGLNGISFPLYHGLDVDDIRSDLVDVMSGRIIDPQFIFHKYNVSSKEEYFKNIGEYCVCCRTESHDDTREKYLTELNKLKLQERELKRDLGIE